MEKKELEEKLKNDKFLNAKENLVIINDNNKNGNLDNLGIITNENFNLIYEKNKTKEFKQIETNSEQLNEIIEHLKIQLSVKDNEILMEKIKQDKYKNELDTLKSNYMKEINRQQLEVKIKDIELKDFESKYNNLKRKIGEDSNNNNNLKDNIDINEEIMAIKKELESKSKIELENEKNLFKKRLERELNRKEEALNNRIKVVEIKADEEVEIYKKKLLEKTKNEIEEFRKNYNIIQLNEIRQKEKELDKKIKEAIIIKKRELVHQENKVFTARKHEIENAFYKLIKEKQHELEEKYLKRIMNLKYIIDNTPQLNNDEENKSLAKIINDLKDEILSLNESLSLEKQINKNNLKKIKSLEENHKNEIENLLKSHFSNIDNNTIFNNKTLSLFDKDYLEKIYNDITSKMNEDIYLQENKDDKEIIVDSLNKNSYMKKRLNEIFAAFQIYTWKLHDTIEEYENQIKNINWSQKLNESTTSTTQNGELIKLENKFKLLLKEKEAEYLRILTELELDNYMKETNLIEQSLLNNKNFNNLHYEEQLKALETKYQSSIKMIDNEKKSSSVLTNENKKLRQIVERDRRTIEYDNKLLKKYKRQIDFLEKTLNIETQGRDKVLQGYIQQIHQGKGKRGKTKTAEFVNIDGVINACKRGDDDQRTDDDNRQKDGHSELTTEDFINSLNTDRYNTRENDNKDEHSEETENEDKETNTIDLDSYDTTYDTTARTTEMSTELNTEEIKKEEEEEDDDDDENDNNSDNDYVSEHPDQDNKRNNIGSDNDSDNDSDSDSDNDNYEVDDDESNSMSLDNQNKKSRREKMRYSKMGKSLRYSNKINKDNIEHKKLRSIKIDRRGNNSHRKEETINKENILPKNYNNEKYDLRNKKDKNKSIEVFDNDYLESSSEEEVSESIKEEIRTLLEDIPELNNKYYILNKIGEGTFSSVYKALRIDEEKKRKERIRKKRENKYYAKKIKDKKYYALKRIYATSSPQRIENEISILHDLRKKSNIVSIYSCVRYEDQVILVLPYVQHNDFRNYLNTMTMDDIRYYMISILTALKHCHELYIMHRDIKPSNFLYDVKNKTGVLVDFGLAQRMDEADIAASKAAKKTLPINTHNKRPLGEMSGNTNSEFHNKKLKTGKKTSKSLKTKLPVNSNSNNNTVEAIDEEDSENNENRYVPDINNEIPIDIPTFNNGKIHPLSVMATVPKYGKPGYIKNDVRPAIRANRAGTRGFRAPEVLFKCVHQTVAIDIWSVGVILLSMFTQRFPFFNSNDDYEALLELGCIFGKQRMKYVAYVLERTYETNIPSVDRHISFQKLCQSLNPKKYIPKEGIDFLTCLLTLDPKTRITAKDALEHPFLKNFDEKKDLQSITDDKINE
jgi:serine/threonine protein kinase